MTLHASSEWVRILRPIHHVTGLLPREQSCVLKERSRKREQKPGAVVIWTLLWIWRQVAVNAVSKNLNDRAGGAGRLKGKKAKQLVMQAQQQQQSAAAAAMMQLNPSSSSASNAAGKEVVVFKWPVTVYLVECW